MSVRKRCWKTSKGERREAWVVDYVDGRGERHIETFKRKKDADDHHASVKVDVRQGIHTAASKSLTVAQAADNWIVYIEGEGRERSTIEQYKQHIRHHIGPTLGNVKLAQLTAPRVQAFRDELLASLSRPMAKKVLVSLKSILRDAQRRGDVAQNVATSVKITMSKRDQKRPEVGIDIPTPAEIQKLFGKVEGKARALLAVMAFAGLRSSEARGLRWSDIEGNEIHVRQRANKWNEIGNPKSETSARSVPIGPGLAQILKVWQVASPPNEGDLVFPSTRELTVIGQKEINRTVDRAQVKAGLTGDGGVAKYGPHAFRHFFASWCINRRVDGGLELPPKVVQDRMGHASITLTMDTYGHLFPRSDDRAEIAAAETALLN